MKAVLDHREEEFRARDAFAYALLGVISFATRLEQKLEQLEPAAAFTSAADWQLDTALGFISLTKKALAELRTWRDSAGPALGPSTASTPRPHLDLLR